ncbi:MAG: phosphoribosylglycinamide formyltransferase [Bacteroidales bacterium]|jgi:phosphoribosylglycinamide formyltransferase-1|nr:phosphoribosylglycinamide formyltransferase [Bacteroidales bacterium]
MKGIVIFASGSGSNVQRIAEYFSTGDTLRILGIYCNRADARVLERAKNLHIPALVFGKDEFYHSDEILDRLKALAPDLIVLAGFLWKVPEKIIRAFPQRIINIHPALLPLYGGKGMYGEHVHRAVIANGEKQSGISIHYVDENYDRGALIMQEKCEVLPGDTPETLAERIHQLEHAHFPATIEQVLLQQRNTACDGLRDAK